MTKLTDEQRKKKKEYNKLWQQANRAHVNEYFRGWLAKNDNRRKRSLYELERQRRKKGAA